MTKSEALKVLKLTENEQDESVIQDAFELELFDLKNYFVRNTPIVALFKKRFAVLRQLIEVGEHFQFDFLPVHCGEIEKHETQDFLSFLRAYEAQQVQIKGRLYASYNPYEIECTAKQLLQLELWYVEQCIAFGIEQKYETQNVEAPKIADKLDSGKMIVLLTQEETQKKQPIELVAEYVRCLAYSKLNNSF